LFITAGYWSLGKIENWILIIRYWIFGRLDAGYWLLVTGLWVLEKSAIVNLYSAIVNLFHLSPKKIFNPFTVNRSIASNGF